MENTVETEIIAAVKMSLRISTNTFNTKLNKLNNTSKQKMKMKGMQKIDDSEKLTRQAIKLYCRANFANGDTKERELYADRYEKLAAAMSLCSFYDKADENGT